MEYANTVINSKIIWKWYLRILMLNNQNKTSSQFLLSFDILKLKWFFYIIYNSISILSRLCGEFSKSDFNARVVIFMWKRRLSLIAYFWWIKIHSNKPKVSRTIVIVILWDQELTDRKRDNLSLTKNQFNKGIAPEANYAKHHKVICLHVLLPILQHQARKPCNYCSSLR